MIFLQAFFFLTLLSALRDISTKHSLKSIDSDVLAWYTALVICIITLPLVFYVWFPSFSWELFWVSLLTGFLYFSFKYLSFTALSLWDISYISPLKGLITFGAIFTEFLVFWILPNTFWFLWIVFLCLGAYFVALKSKKDFPFEPIKRIFTEKSSQIYLFVILITSCTVVLDKVWVQLSNPYFWVSLMQFFIFVFSLRSIIKKSWKYFPLIKKSGFSFSLTVFLNSITLLAQMNLLLYLSASYVSAFKTASSIVIVLIWWWVFQERYIKIRFIGSLIMMFWILLISFSDKIIAFLNSPL